MQLVEVGWGRGLALKARYLCIGVPRSGGMVGGVGEVGREKAVLMTAAGVLWRTPVWGVGLGVLGLGFGVWGLGFEVWLSKYRV